jgi:hypothetical protein
VVLPLAVAPAVLAGAATVSPPSPIGSWPDGYAYVLAGKDKGGPYPHSAVITSYDRATGAFSGIDDAWGIGRETVEGTIQGDTVTETETYGDIVDHAEGKWTISSGGVETWSGTFSNSIGQSGTFSSSRRVFDLAGTITVGCLASSSSCSAEIAPISDINVAATAGTEDFGAITDDDGKWNAEVPSGQYTITPSATDITFAPADREVDTAGLTNGLDFKACGMVTTPAATAAADVFGTGEARWRLAGLGGQPAASSTWTLQASTCNNWVMIEYRPTSASHAASAHVAWRTIMWSCREPNTNVTHKVPRDRYLLSGYQVGRTEGDSIKVASDGAVSIHVNTVDKVNGSAMYGKTVSLLDATLTEGGEGGTVSINPAAYRMTDFCEPVGMKAVALKKIG